MRVKKISVQNFLSLDNFELDLDDNLTVIVGFNGSGKTNLVRALELAREVSAWGGSGTANANALEKWLLCRRSEEPPVFVEIDLSFDDRWERDLMHTLPARPLEPASAAGQPKRRPVRHLFQRPAGDSAPSGGPACGRYIRLQRWEKYVPREEAPDGPAGRRVAYFDELLFIPVLEDAVRADGVITGEYHFAEGLQPDQYGPLKAAPGVEALLVMPFGYLGPFFNKKQGLFTSQRLRQAVLAAADLEHAMLTAFGSKEFIRLGPELAPPETLWYKDAGKEVYNRPDPEQVRRLMREAGYEGQPVRWMTTRAYPFHYNLSLSFREQLERAGFKVDLQVLDWAALVNRRSNPELWDVFVTHWVVFEHPAIRSPLSGAWPGWWESERKDRILAAIWAEPERERQKQLVQELQQLVWEEVPWIQAGQFAELRAIRKDVASYWSFPQWFFWNCGFAG